MEQKTPVVDDAARSVVRIHRKTRGSMNRNFSEAWQRGQHSLLPENHEDNGVVRKQLRTA
eukprot:6204851-Pleurochrysis_carterae.AAC.5